MKKRLLVIALIGWAVAATVVAIFAPVKQVRVVDTRDYEGVHQISLIQLIVTPEKFDGKLVSFVAFLDHEFEGNHFYVRREDFERGIMAHALYYDVTPELSKRAQLLRRRYVIVEGRFVMGRLDTKHGHESMTTLTQITRLDPWPFLRSAAEEPIQSSQPTPGS